MPRKRLIWQLFPSYLLVTLLSLLALTWYATASWRQFYLEQTESDLKNRALLVQDYLRGDLSAAKDPEVDQLCKNLGRLTATRLTVILPSGQVLGDSEEDPARMENHGDRPEVQAALQGRVGTSGRYSFTLGHDRMYVAIPLKEQGRIVGVVRASLPMTAIAQALRALYWKIALGGLVIVLLLAALSLFISQRISRPLEDLKRGALRFAGGDLSRRLPVPAADELGSLAEAFNHMAEQLEDRINALIRQGQLQEAVLSSMVEGVLAVDADQRLITLNRAGGPVAGRRLRNLPGPQHPGSGAGPAVAELHHPHHLCPGARGRRSGAAPGRAGDPGPRHLSQGYPRDGYRLSHRAARRHPPPAPGDDPAGLRGQRLPRTENAHHLHQGLRGDPAGRGAA